MSSKIDILLLEIAELKQQIKGIMNQKNAMIATLSVVIGPNSSDYVTFYNNYSILSKFAAVLEEELVLIQARLTPLEQKLKSIEDML
jgi:wobble nucleotide-excising tRNase